MVSGTFAYAMLSLSLCQAAGADPSSLLRGSVDAPVRTSLACEPACAVSSGGKIVARLTFIIEAGWHIASLKRSDVGPMATEIQMSDSQPFKLIGSIVAPRPQKEYNSAFDADIEYYANSVIFKLPVVATQDIEPGTKLSLQVRYQACSREQCLLPKSEDVTAAIGVVPQVNGKVQDGR